MNGTVGTMTQLAWPERIRQVESSHGEDPRSHLCEEVDVVVVVASPTSQGPHTGLIYVYPKDCNAFRGRLTARMYDRGAWWREDHLMMFSSNVKDLITALGQA